VRPRTVLAPLGTMLCVATGVICHQAPAQAAPDNCPATAAAAYQWGAPNKSDDFDDPSSLAGWNLYNGPGHAGNGRRTPSAVSVADGVLTITGDSRGNSEGMSWSPGQTFGRWVRENRLEGCAIALRDPNQRAFNVSEIAVKCRLTGQIKPPWIDNHCRPIARSSRSP